MRYFDIFLLVRKLVAKFVKIKNPETTMKRTFLFTALAAMLVATSCAGSGSKSEAESISTKKEAPKRQGWDNEIYGPLYGNVESITVTLYHLTEKNGEVVKNGIKCKDNYKFDREGNVVEKTGYDSDDLQVEKDLYKSDSRGTMIEEDYSYYRGSGYKSKNTYKYDPQNNYIERVRYEGEAMMPVDVNVREIVYRE